MSCTTPYDVRIGEEKKSEAASGNVFSKSFSSCAKSDFSLTSRVPKRICILKVKDLRENARMMIRRQRLKKRRGEEVGKRKPAAYAVAGR